MKMNWFQETVVTKTEFTFDGDVVIRIEPKVSGVQKIVLHKHDLDISSYILKRGEEIVLSEDFAIGQYNDTTDKWTIDVTPPLTMAQEYTLQIFYKGYMRDDMEGFYRSYYLENGKKVWMGTTQFQQTEARRAFPCFDVRKTSLILRFNLKLLLL